MTEPMFFRHTGGLTVGEIVSLTDAKPFNDVRLDRRIHDVASLDLAGPDDLIYFDKAKFSTALGSTQAAVCLTSTRLADQVPTRLMVLCCDDPYRAFVKVAGSLFPDSIRPSSFFAGTGEVPGAFVHPSARLESGVTVDPGAVVGPRAEIGTGTVIAATATIGPGVRIGRNCSIGAGAAIIHALIGDRVIIHAGARIGTDGFGYISGTAGHKKIPQVKRVIIQDDVEIGANSTIDRGGLRDTTIGEGTKIDNQVHIGHNVSIGRHCILAGQVGISGSVVIGDYVVLGGQVGVADNVTIGEGASFAGASAVFTNAPAGARWGGAPALPAREWMRGVALLRRLLKRENQASAPDEDQK